MLPQVDYVSVNGESFIKCFSAAQAVKIFEAETGVKFSSVSLGKLLASSEIKTDAKNVFKEKVYSGTKYWNFAWRIMVNHVCDKAIYDKDIVFNDRSLKAPECPLSKVDDIVH